MLAQHNDKLRAPETEAAPPEYQSSLKFVLLTLVLPLAFILSASLIDIPALLGR